MENLNNCTIADHLHGKLANSNSNLFSWPVRLNIAIKTADTLAYLHKSDIIHRDVKTNNILVDKSFKVKVADFGLSRLFPVDATHVSSVPQVMCIATGWSGEEDDYVGGGAGFSVSSIGEGFEADDGGGGGDFARDSG
ncbi:hypothetical protein L2E82_24944 [Cichorium intybus]|uniref:Uncharacterized protein n=1 Tax=Cichorium intybus TaxID=13427 RepID=A0ACB9E1P7_CICIN|nr:hypothetical protein L2E82_24944 [Cichorium intybus]